MKKIIPFLALFVILASGCTRKEKDILLGTWRFVEESSYVNASFTITFNDDGTVVRQLTAPKICGNSPANASENGVYSVTADLRHKYITINDMDPICKGQVNFNAKWTIIKIDDSSLILAHNWITEKSRSVIVMDFVKIQ
jgi:hypothetical protein